MEDTDKRNRRRYLYLSLIHILVELKNQAAEKSGRSGDDVLLVAVTKLHTVEAVSYTHLDVYKRQGKDIAEGKGVAGDCKSEGSRMWGTY